MVQSGDISEVDSEVNIELDSEVGGWHSNIINCQQSEYIDRMKEEEVKNCLLSYKAL